MTNLIQSLAQLRRPGLLIRAARLGQGGYRRKRDLRRITGDETLVPPEHAVLRLLDIEAELDLSRRSGDARYSPTRHVETMIALMAEARALLARGPVLVEGEGGAVAGAARMPCEPQNPGRMRRSLPA
ncbi:MAG: DUF6477 family protein [Tropicimonas sp.]|uniref:DUF6477 family protein n=1 Tax=Tropicimonas sp. TaxID=2067044 RepID=UPI003A838914